MAVRGSYFLYPFKGRWFSGELMARGVSSASAYSSHAIRREKLIVQRPGHLGWILEGKGTADERRLEQGRMDQLTEKVIRCAFAVSNTLGCGFLEKVYYAC